MALSRDTLETGFALLAALVDDEPELARELETSRTVFFGPGGPAEDDAFAGRRHLEWFLLERPSGHLDGVPVEVWLERWSAEAGAIERDHVEALLNSRAGVYEITGVEGGRGLWLQDLLSGGEYPVDEREAAEALAAGDLVVGRVFPVGDTLYRLSPAAACFRSAGLVEALRRDMEALRAGRRGTLRIQQSELERMFHGGPGAAGASAPGAPSDPEVASVQARDALVDAGAPAELASGLVDELRERAADDGSGRAVSEALDRLAFDTDADLEAARRELLDLWGTLRSTVDAPADAPRSPRAPHTPHTPQTNGRAARSAQRPGPREAEEGAPPEAVEDALRRFDEARAEGGDLDALFDALEHDLGLDGAGGEPEPAQAPDFPGVVGAMVEEFLWETEREQGQAAARAHAPLRTFGAFASGVGVFENLGRRELLDFSARHLLDEAGADGPTAHAILASLAAFCRWSEERHEVPLWGAFGDTLETLQRSVPRLADARRHCAGEARGAALFTVDRDGGGALLLVDAEGEVHRPELEEALDGRLRPGDLVRAIRREGRTRISACYPAELQELADPAEPDDPDDPDDER